MANPLLPTAADIGFGIMVFVFLLGIGSAAALWLGPASWGKRVLALIGAGPNPQSTGEVRATTDSDPKAP